MKPTVRNILLLLGTLLPGAAALADSPQPEIPRPLTIVVPFSPGASNDGIARSVAPQLAAKLNTSVIVENRAGAAGVIGSDFVARAPKNGAVLLLTSSTFLTSAATQEHMPYDPIKDFAPVSMIGQGPLILAVSGSKPYQSLPSLLERARATPNAMNYGTAGVGSLAHLATVMLDDAAKITMTHIPYKGAANAASDLAGGRIDLMLANYSSIAPLVDSKKVTLIATTAEGQSAAFPTLPPAESVLPGYHVSIWVGVFAPAGTPQALLDVYNRALNEIARFPATTALLDMDGTVPAALSSAEFGKLVEGDLARWKEVSQAHHISSTSE